MNNDSNMNSRVKRNSELYKQISDADIENYEIKSNATVIGDASSFDVNKIKSILDNHYNDAPKRRSIVIEQTEKKIQNYDNETKEYDLNMVIDKAKEEKESTYDDVRSSKLNDTNYKIFENIKKENYIEDYEEETKDNLATLIDTISLNENKTNAMKKEEPNENEDLFASLKGDDKTEVLDGALEKTQKIDKVASDETNKIDNSFYTTTNAFKEKDFEDYEPMMEEEKSGGVFIKIIIALLIIIFIAGVVILVKSFL